MQNELFMEKILDTYGNIFYQIVQEFFYEDILKTPHSNMLESDNWKIYYMYGGIPDNRHMVAAVDGIVNTWLEIEEPTMIGKQLMIRSFFMKDLVDRKVVACIPAREFSGRNILFEGGIKVPVNSEIVYSKATATFDELGFFSMSELSNVLMEPGYFWGKCFMPSELSVEWHKVFLFLCAIQEEKWTIKSFLNLYGRFLKFLGENICDIVAVEPWLDVEIGIQIFLKRIEDIRSFLKGKDESVISKDFWQTLSTRYVYMEYLLDFIGREEIKAESFSNIELNQRIKIAEDDINSHEKGLLWESVAEYVLSHVGGWKIMGRRIKAGYQEIDLSVVNISESDNLWELGPYILVECKNWKRKVNLPTIRNIAYISNMKGNKTSILFARNGITENAAREIKRLAVDHMYVLCIEKKDLMELKSAKACTQLILDKWRVLVECGEDIPPI